MSMSMMTMIVIVIMIMIVNGVAIRQRQEAAGRKTGDKQLFHTLCFHDRWGLVLWFLDPER